MSRLQRVLHVAALPFPSHQGTQGAIASMLEASAADGRDAQLLTYGGHDDAPRAFEHHRVPGVERPSLRSGPSLQKLLLDARMFGALRALRRRIRPDVIVAHHVEAASLVLAQRGSHWVFFAHTDLAVELPTYAPRRAAALLSQAGRRFDQLLLAAAPAVAVISPALREQLARHAPAAAHKMAYVPVPWKVADAITAEERVRSRQRLGYDDDHEVLLYAGNLDAYQGLDSLLHATAITVRDRPRTRLLVATASRTDGLLRMAAQAGLGAHLRVTELRGEPARRAAHAAADLAVVPRLSPGGLPIKLLDALSRGVPSVVAPRACAGLSLAGAALVTQDDGPESLAQALLELLAAPHRQRALSQTGPTYIRQSHAPEQFLGALDTLCRTRVSVS